MKFEKGVLICSFLIMIFIGVVSAESTCTVRSGTCSAGETPIIKLFGLQNTHGELVSQNNYNNVLCCAGVSSTSCSGTNEILRLSSATNAHAESPPLNYAAGNGICATGLSCTTATGSCPSGKNAILSLSSVTNAHISVGDNTNYNTKICCDVSTIPRCDDNIPGNTPNVECDDGNSVNNDACTNECKNAKCGDGIVQAVKGENCELPNANCVLAGQTGECKCALGYEPNALGGCVKGSTDNIAYCRDVKISAYDDNDILDKIEENCEGFTDSQDSPQEDSKGCLYNIKCIWTWTDESHTEGVCEAKPDTKVNPDAEECKNSDLSGCDWKESASGVCGEGVDIVTIEYLVQSSDPAEQLRCAINPQTVPCPETSMLPFFGAYQLIISLTVISIIYIFLIYRKSRND